MLEWKHPQMSLNTPSRKGTEKFVGSDRRAAKRGLGGKTRHRYNRVFARGTTREIINSEGVQFLLYENSRSITNGAEQNLCGDRKVFEKEYIRVCTMTPDSALQDIHFTDREELFERMHCRPTSANKLQTRAARAPACERDQGYHNPTKGKGVCL